MSNISDDSKKNPIDFRHDRRSWLKASATAIGASFLPLSAATIAEAQDAPTKKEKDAAATPAKAVGRFFTPAQHKLVEELSETIIPKDSHSGGAKDAKVADFIDQHVGESGDKEKQDLWREGLRLIDSMSQ